VRDLRVFREHDYNMEEHCSCNFNARYGYMTLFASWHEVDHSRYGSGAHCAAAAPSGTSTT
jgi:hypothetical protein